MSTATAALRVVDHDAVLSLTDHLTELRARLLLCAATLAVLFGACLWQSRPLLEVLDRPLSTVAHHPTPGAGTDRATRDALAAGSAAFAQLSGARGLDAAQRTATRRAAAALGRASRRLDARAAPKPTTIGLGEPFTTSVTVALAFALLLGAPLLLWQAWSFAAPAVAPGDRAGVRRLLLLSVALFVGGVAFAYWVVLPPAVRFLQGFNGGAFQALVQARDYYHFELTTMLAVGGMFQLPVLALAAGAAGFLSAAMLRAHRRVAIVVLAVLAALLPGTDPVTTALEIVPLVGLYELSIALLALRERRGAKC